MFSVHVVSNRRDAFLVGPPLSTLTQEISTPAVFFLHLIYNIAFNVYIVFLLENIKLLCMFHDHPRFNIGVKCHSFVSIKPLDTGQHRSGNPEKSFSSMLFGQSNFNMSIGLYCMDRSIVLF